MDDHAARRHRLRRQELAAFLRARRERTDPREVGLALLGQRRRTPGLRREELAMLAGMSVDYYTRLEQGRDLQASPAVIDSIARAMQLGPAERDHLFRLSGCGPLPRQEKRAETVRPSVRQVLDGLHRNPALVLGRCCDILAWNQPAVTLMVDFATVPERDRNLVVFVFTDPRASTIYPDWQHVALDCVGTLRNTLGRYPDDEATTSLVSRLLSTSPRFATMWAQHTVREKTSDTKSFAHPELGRFTLDVEVLRIGATDQQLIVYSAPQDSGAQAILELLAARRIGN